MTSSVIKITPNEAQAENEKNISFNKEDLLSRLDKFMREDNTRIIALLNLINSEEITRKDDIFDLLFSFEGSPFKTYTPRFLKTKISLPDIINKIFSGKKIKEALLALQEQIEIRVNQILEKGADPLKGQTFANFLLSFITKKRNRQFNP